MSDTGCECRSIGCRFQYNGMSAKNTAKKGKKQPDTIASGCF